MKSVFAFGVSLGAAALVFAVFAFVPACSSKTATAADPNALQTTCDPTQCLAGNECIQGDGELKCRRPCASNTDPATNCPAGATCYAGNTPSTIPTGCTKGAASATTHYCAAFSALGGTHLTNYACPDGAAPTGCVAAADAGQWCCNDAPAETYAKPFCKRLVREIKAGPKQWGTACNPTGGLDTNPDCDTAQGFYCYGTGPADAAAYCTRYDCHADTECAPGFFCGTVNVAPNVTTSKATLHQTTTVCQRRDFCAPCQVDFDCPALSGVPQHCVQDQSGVGFCGPECKTSANCPYEAKCVDAGIGVFTCYPRAGVCVGDSSLCSPCRNDGDCGADGLCVKGQYTTEHACAKMSGGSCSAGGKQCPTSAAPMAHIGCTQMADGDIPADYCVGLYDFGSPSPGQQQPTDIGCWTPAR